MSSFVRSGNHTLIPLTNAITEAKRYLKIQDTTDEDTLEILAWNAVRWIAPLSSFGLQMKEVEICNGKAELPHNCIRFLWYTRVYPNQPDDPCCFADTNTLLTAFNLAVPSASPIFQAFDLVQVVNNSLDFGCHVDFDKVRIAFMGYEVDDQGVFLITDLTKQAIVFKICAEYSLMEYEKYGKVQGVYERKATFAANKVRSIDFSTNFREHKNEVGQMLRAYWYSPIVGGIPGAPTFLP